MPLPAKPPDTRQPRIERPLTPGIPARRAACQALLTGAALGSGLLAGCTTTATSGTGAAPTPTLVPSGPPALPAQYGVEEVPYVQTPQPVVDAMLGLAALRAGDRLIDLGSGDGRVVIAAARRFGVAGLGVEIDPQLVTLSQQRAREAGVADLARFATQDLFDTDLASATVITLYLLPDVNLALRPRLLQLAPGTRIVSHDWDMAEWLPERSVTLPAPGKPVGRRQESTLHLWIVPARMAGTWQGAIEGDPGSRLSLSIEQRFQQLAIDWRWVGTPPAGLPASGRAAARVNGAAADFTVSASGGDTRVSLRRNGDLLEAGVETAGGRRQMLLRAN